MKVEANGTRAAHKVELRWHVPAMRLVTLRSSRRMWPIQVAPLLADIEELVEFDHVKQWVKQSLTKRQHLAYCS